MKLIVGLGNPGIKYEKTRHNLGFRIAEELARQIKFNHWKVDLQFHTSITQGHFNSQKIILAKPQTFMNNSGLAVKALVKYYKIPFEETLIIHDDIDLPLGKIKIQKSRGAAGHKGVQSIIDNLRTKNFVRIRIGIKSSTNQSIDTEKFVLEKFTLEEEKVIQKIIERAVQMVATALGRKTTRLIPGAEEISI